MRDAGVLDVVFETHSLTEDNERGIATGWLPGRLSTRGRDLAIELGARRRDDGIDAVYTSDLARAVETARMAFARSPIPLRQDARLREVNFGELNGAAAERLSGSVRLAHIATPFPGGQSYRDVVAAMQAFLSGLALDASVRRALIIGHTATRHALDVLLAGRALEDCVGSPFD